MIMLGVPNRIRIDSPIPGGNAAFAIRLPVVRTQPPYRRTTSGIYVINIIFYSQSWCAIFVPEYNNICTK